MRCASAYGKRKTRVPARGAPDGALLFSAPRPSRDVVIAGHQEVTREWSEQRRGEFDVYTTEVVVEEARDGDPDAAAGHLGAPSGLRILKTTEDAEALARVLVAEGALPGAAGVDALHAAAATVHGMDMLLTWNLSHLANAEAMPTVARVLRSNGYEPPVICTPDQLMGDYDA